VSRYQEGHIHCNRKHLVLRRSGRRREIRGRKGGGAVWERRDVADSAGARGFVESKEIKWLTGFRSFVLNIYRYASINLQTPNVNYS